HGGAIGRTVWNVGSFFIPGAGQVKWLSKLNKLQKAAPDVPDVPKPRDARPDDDASPNDAPPAQDPDACPLGGCNEPGKNCFAAGTPVHTERGLRAIEDVEVGDFVWSREERGGELALQRVAHKFITPNRPVHALVFAGEELHSTAEHPFFTSRGWTPAGSLQAGDWVELFPDAWAQVLANEPLPERVTVYNFEVENYHTYFVGKDGAWVHNTCPELTEDGKGFKDPALQQRYEDYIKRKKGENVRPPLEWKEASDYMQNLGPTARGNAFNEQRRFEQAYPYDEVEVVGADGKRYRVDSYDPDVVNPETGVRGEIIERKAVDFDAIDSKTFENYLTESARKYPEGQEIRSRKYRQLTGVDEDGNPLALQGAHVIEVPLSNKTASNAAEFEALAAKHNFTVRYVQENWSPP
ncbi:MAG: polymorphic toxin-type HINT domain-containing protein, partial [Polyangiales bacterium]